VPGIDGRGSSEVIMGKAPGTTMSYVEGFGAGHVIELTRRTSWLSLSKVGTVWDELVSRGMLKLAVLLRCQKKAGE
jgi:hypothetical protein